VDFEGHRYDLLQSRVEGNELVLTCRQDDHERKAELAFAKNQHTENKSIKAQKLIDDYLPIHSFTLQRPTGILIQQNKLVCLLPDSPFIQIAPPPKLG
ncbi:MAG: hypothetical protein ACRCYO_15885, partial [Bacteroidia bacterium]